MNFGLSIERATVLPLRSGKLQNTKTTGLPDPAHVAARVSGKFGVRSAGSGDILNL